MTPKLKSRILYLLGMLVCILPCGICTLEYFPLWLNAGGGQTLSALAVLVLLLCAVPLKKFIKKYLKSPSAWSMWLVLLVFLLLFKSITDGLLNIALVAFPTNLLGAVLFKISARVK